MFKRWFSLALAVAFAAASVCGALPSARADVVTAEIEPAVPEQGEVAIAFGEWTPVDAADETAPDDDADAPDDDADAPDADAAEARFAVLGSDADVFDAPDADAPWARLAADSPVLILDAGAARARVAFHADGAFAEGWIDAEVLDVLEGEALEAYLDAAAETGAALYCDDVRLPLAPAAFADTETAPESPEAPEGPATPEQPTVEDPTGGDGASEEGSDPVSEIVAGDDPTPTPSPSPSPDPSPAPELRLSETSVTLGEGEAREAPGVECDLTEVPDVTWTSEDAEVAAVDASTGAIVGLSAGTTHVRAEAEGASARCEIVVKAAPQALVLSAEALELNAGGMSVRLEAASTSDYTGALTFASSDPSVAAVDAEGVVTAGAAGTAVITVTAYNGVCAQCSVKVNPAPETIVFGGVEGASATLGVAQRLWLKASALDAKGAVTPAEITYSISPNSADPGCVRVGAVTGKVTGVRKGRAFVVATAYNGASAACEIEVLPAPARVKLSRASVTLGKGEAYDGVVATCTPPTGEARCHTTLTWTSSDRKVARVDKRTGVITGAGVGTATVTVTTHDGKSASCTVTVKKAPDSIALSETIVTLGAGGMTARLAPVLPEGTASGKLTFSSNRPSVATVDEKGVVTSRNRVGQATLTVTAFNGVSATCRVKVLAAPASVVLNGAADNAVAIAVGQPLWLKGEARDADGAVTPATITYAVSPNSADPGCVKLNTSTGKITGVRKGSAFITATAHNGVGTVCKVDVLPAPSDMTISAASAEIGAGEAYGGVTVRLTPPAGETECLTVFTWTSSNKKVARVDKRTGVITGVKPGTAVVNVKTHNGLTAQCRVTVKAAPESIALSPASLAMSAGGMTARLTPVLPKGTASGKLTFASSRPAVASVDADGMVVTGRKAGTAVVTVTAFNGVSARCKITVKAEPAAIVFGGAPENETTLGIGQTRALKASARDAEGKVTPAGITYAVAADSRNPGCIAVDAETGKVTAVKKGRAAVIATAHNGVSARCEIRVLAAPGAIALNTDSVIIGIGEAYAGVTAVLTPPEGEKKCAAGIIWRSKNRNVARVDGTTGVITGVAAGSCTIYAKTHNGLIARCRVEVRPAPQSIALDVENLALSAGGMKAQLTVSLPEGCASGALTFESSDPDVASVSASGLVKGKQPGSAVVTVTAFNGVSGQCEVTVGPAPEVIAFPGYEDAKPVVATERTLTVAAEARTAEGEVTPANITYTVSKKSLNPECITVDPATGAVTGVSKGRAYVLARAHNGAYARCLVYVGAEPESIQLEEKQAVLGAGETHEPLKYALLPPEGEPVAATVLTWSSSDATVLAVDPETGAFEALAPGQAVLTAMARNKKKARCTVTVMNPPDSLTISPREGSLTVGDTGRYSVTMPDGCCGRVTFESSNPVVASIDDDGVVTALKRGSTTITARAYNGVSAEARLTVSGYGDPPPTDQYDDLTPTVTEYRDGLSNHDKLEYVLYVALSKVGKPYVYGSFGPDSFDCSGFTTYCFRQIGIELKHSAYLQGYDTRIPIVDYMTQLRRGDLIYFDTNGDDDDLSDHAGIYLGNGYFIHASSSAGKVIISQFVSKTSNYYTRVFSWGRRVLDQEGF